MTDKKFIKGLWFNLPHEKAPDFIKGNISISKDSFMEWLKAEKPNEKGYIKIDLKVSRENKPYAEINTYKSDQSKQGTLGNEQVDNADGVDETSPDGVPF